MIKEVKEKFKSLLNNDLNELKPFGPRTSNSYVVEGS